ncbi:MAG: hypothetical protein QOI08_1841 [Actinomycetota bacterium]|nr:hypothetical protein [Actinomycetota bacterium]
MGLRRSGFLALVMSLVFVAAGCDWSMFAYGPAHTSFNPGESTIGVDDVASLHEAWTASLGAPGGGSVAPVTSARVVYATSDVFPFVLEAFDERRATGCSGTPNKCAPLWTATLRGAARSLDVANGFVYVTTAAAQLLAFDAAGGAGCSGNPKTCNAIWSASGLADGSAQPAITDSFVYAPVGQGVSAFDAAGVDGCSGMPKTCAPLWSVVGWSPAVANGVLSGARVAHTFEVRAYDAAGVTKCAGSPKTCAPLWVGDTGINPDVLPAVTAPTISNGVVWIGIDNGDELSNGGALVGFDATGSRRCAGTPKICTPTWRAATDGVEYPPAVAKHVVYALQFFHSGEVQVTTRYTLSAFDFAACHTTTATCSPLWTVHLAASPQGLAIANGLVYVSTFSERRIAAYDAAGVNGCSGSPRVCAPLWTTTLSGSPTSPVVANGVVYASTRDDNVLHAYKLP